MNDVPFLEFQLELLRDYREYFHINFSSLKKLCYASIDRHFSRGEIVRGATMNANQISTVKNVLGITNNSKNASHSVPASITFALNAVFEHKENWVFDMTMICISIIRYFLISLGNTCSCACYAYKIIRRKGSTWALENIP